MVWRLELLLFNRELLTNAVTESVKTIGIQNASLILAFKQFEPKQAFCRLFTKFYRSLQQ